MYVCVYVYEYVFVYVYVYVHHTETEKYGRHFAADIFTSIYLNEIWWILIQI